MMTSVELQMLRNATQGIKLPGIDTVVGDTIAAASLISVTKLTTNDTASVFYNAAENEVVVKGNNINLSGYNFGGATLDIEGNNDTVKNCSFSWPTGWYSVQQFAGFSGAIIANCSFAPGPIAAPQGGYITSSGNITITNDSFLDAPDDAVDIQGGTVTGNYFSGAGYQAGGHADAIWVTDSTTPTVISNNMIDWTANPGTPGWANDTIRITTELGSVNNVTVSSNFLIGGSYTVDAGNEGTEGTFTNIKIDNNYIGFGQYGSFYPGPQTGVTSSGNQIIDFTNPAYSQAAWATYKAAGILTTNLVISAGAGKDISGAASGSTTLYGGGTIENLYGTANETIFVGGAGRQYLRGGAGKNIYEYLSISDSAYNSCDEIYSFTTSRDVIDLSHLDANLTAAGVQSFTFIGTAAFSGAGGQLRYQQDLTTGMTDVEANLVGDSGIDLFIEVAGLLTLTASNFALTAAQSAAATAPAATVASLKDSAPSAALDAGQTVVFTVNFNNAVTVSGGVPALTLNDGGAASYTSGSGTNALSFSYTVAAGQNIALLAITGASLGASSIRDGNGNNAVLTGVTASLPTALTIDTKAPTITSVTAKATSADLRAGQTATLTAAFSEIVKFSGGIPSLTLNDGATATYLSGSGTSALTFSYTVASGQNTSKLAVTALSLNGASLTDVAGNAAVLTGVTTSITGALQIDTVAPTITNVATSIASGREVVAGQTLVISLSASEAAIVSGAPALLLNDGQVATYDASHSTATTLAFDYVVGKEVSTDLAVVGIEASNGATITDGAGNATVLAGLNVSTGVEVNTTKYAVTSLGTGAFSFGSKTFMEIFGPSTANVSFSAGAAQALELANSQSFAGTIAALALGDVIDLADVNFVTGGSVGFAGNSAGSGGELTVTEGSHALSLAMSGSYHASSFSLSSDGHGGTLLSDGPANAAALTLLGVAHA